MKLIIVLLLIIQVSIYFCETEEENIEKYFENYNEEIDQSESNYLLFIKYDLFSIIQQNEINI
jgi:hypothetical protein